jgi:hypothetical protein
MIAPVVILDLDITDAIKMLDTQKTIKKQEAKNILMMAGNIFISRTKSKLTQSSLRESIGNPTKDGIYKYSETSDEMILEVGTKRKEMIWIELGVKPHPISTSGRALVFNDRKSQKKIFAKRARHPGFKGKFAMTSALAETKSELLGMIKL